MSVDYFQMQHFITESNWDARALIYQIANYMNSVIPKNKLAGLIIDETGMKIKNYKFLGWTWETQHANYIGIFQHLGFVTVQQTFSAGLSNTTLVSDSWNVKLKTMSKRHKVCLALLLRELNLSQDMFHLKWVNDIKDILNKAIKLKNSITLEQYDQPQEEKAPCSINLISW